MTRDDALEVMRSMIYSIAPSINEQTGIDIPERDHPQLVTVDGCVTYMVAKT